MIGKEVDPHRPYALELADFLESINVVEPFVTTLVSLRLPIA